jgi:hypothetical protein
MLKPAPPMTAAHRQRRCRAGGKGRHRGGTTKRMRQESERLVRAMMAAARATAAAQPVTAEQAVPAPQPEAAPAPQPAAELNVSSMAA